MLKKKLNKLNMQLIALETHREILRNSVLDIEMQIRTVERTIDNLEFQPAIENEKTPEQVADVVKEAKKLFN